MRRSRIVLLAIVIPLLSVSPLTAQEKTTAAGAQTPARRRVGTRAVQILSRPSPDADVVLAADPGTVLNVIDSDGQWYWISLPDRDGGGPRRGWVQAREVQPVDATGTLMIPPTGED